MISASLGLTLVAGVGKVFLATSNSHRHVQALAEVNDNLRFSMAQISQDVSMAGFFAGVHDPRHLVTVTADARDEYSGTCPGSWLFDDRLPIDALDNADPETVQERFPCITGARNGSDVLAVKRVAADCTDSPRSNRFYLHRGPRIAELGIGRNPGGTDCARARSGGIESFQYQPAIWFIADDAGVPALCREGLSGRRTARKCVMRGVEDLQLEFGLDHAQEGFEGDGIADGFHSFNGAPSDLQRHRIVAVRIHLLARSLASAPCRRDVDIRLGNRVHPPFDDSYCRRTLSTTVPLYSASTRRYP